MKYITNYGDTFDIIAFKVYGNEELMGLIMNANPKHIETAVFDQGTEIEVPDVENTAEDLFLPPWRR